MRELESMKDEILDLEELHESEISDAQQRRIDELANEIEILQKRFDLYNA